MKGLRERSVCITGAASGIGLATATRFFEEGARLVLSDLRPLADTDLAARFPERMRYVAGDVSDADVRARLLAAAAEDGASILINNAGITRDASAFKMSDDDWDRVLDVNLSAVFRLSTGFARGLREAGAGGVILSAASVVAHTGNFGQANYVATKSAILGLIRTLAREWGRYGIRVNAVAPGFIDTPMARKVPADHLRALIERTPLQRLGTPEDVAALYAFLASDDAAFITGTCMNVDGGRVL